MYFKDNKLTTKDLFLAELQEEDLDYFNNIKRKYKDILFFISNDKWDGTRVSIKFLLEDVKIKSKGQEYSFKDIYFYYILRSSLYPIYGVHPHIDGSSACLGNSDNLIYKLFDNNFDTGYLALHAILCNIGPRPYFKLESFDKEKKLCINCLEYKTPGYNREVSMCQDCINANGLVHKKEKCISCSDIKLAVGGRISKKGWICNEH